MLPAPLYAKAWTSQIYTEEQYGFCPLRRSLLCSLSPLLPGGAPRTQGYCRRKAQSPQHTIGLCIVLWRRHTCQGHGFETLCPSIIFLVFLFPGPCFYRRKTNRTRWVKLDQKNLCLLLSVLWVSKHNSKLLSSYLNTHSNKEPSVVSSFARQGLQPRVFTAALNVPGEKVMIRNSHVLLRVGINYAGASSKGEG